MSAVLIVAGNVVVIWIAGYIVGRAHQRLRILAVIDARSAEARKMLEASKSQANPVSRLIEIDLVDRMCDGSRAILDALNGKS